MSTAFQGRAPTADIVRRQRRVSICVAVVSLEIVLAARPDLISRPVDIGNSTLTAVTSDQEAIIVRNPASGSGTLLHYATKPGEAIDLSIERARLSPQTLDALAGGAAPPPNVSEPTSTDIFIRGVPAQMRGLTAELTVRTLDRPAKSLTFEEAADSAQSTGRNVTITPNGAGLQVIVTFRSTNPRLDAHSRKMMPNGAAGMEIDTGLIIWRPRLPCGLPIVMSTEAGTRIVAEIADERRLPAISLSQPVEGRPLRIDASSISVEPTSGQAGMVDRLEVNRVLNTDSRLSLTNIEVGQGQISASATGIAVRSGTAQHQRLMRLLSRQPLFPIPIIGLNLALALWVRRAYRPSQR